MNNLNIDPMWIWVAVGVIVVLAIIGLIARGARRSKSEALRERYGSEYEHAIKEKGNRSRAEEDLIARAETAKTFNIRPLTPSEHAGFRSDWDRIEARFLERPTTTVVEADELVEEIMRTRGYPMGDFDKHAADLSVNHPRVVEHYRAGHAAIDSNRDGKSSTEELRKSMLHYRALIDELLGGQRAESPSDVPVQREITKDDEPLRP